MMHSTFKPNELHIISSFQHEEYVNG